VSARSGCRGQRRVAAGQLLDPEVVKNRIAFVRPLRI
jgi:hypothetical protein